MHAARPRLSYRCPLCHSPLQPEARRLVCGQGHSFDIARQGYVNLLPVQRKKSRQPGDSRDMMQNRRAFLERGHYQALVDRLARLLDQACGGQPFTLLDSGCGEGYYTRGLHALCPQGEFHGIDIAKPGIALAARAHPGGHYAVASSAGLPFFDHGFDVCLSIYAPVQAAELRRVIARQGLLMVVRPGPDHLWALKRLIYQQPRRHPPQATELTGFRLEGQQRLRAELDLHQQDDIAHLLRMTPFYWHLDPQRQQRILALESLRTPIDFAIDLYRPLG